jgi:hypothetical protein
MFQLTPIARGIKIALYSNQKPECYVPDCKEAPVLLSVWGPVCFDHADENSIERGLRL